MKKGIPYLIILLVYASFGYAVSASDVYLEWNKTFGGNGSERGFSVQQTIDGGYIMAGWTFSYGSKDVYLIKTDANGNLMWDKAFGGSDLDTGHSVQQTGDGGYIIAGATRSYGTGKWDIWLIKTDMDGILEWNKTFGGIDTDGGYSVRQTMDGGYIISAYTFSYGAGRSDVYLIKTDSDGNLEWNRTFGGSGGDYGSSVYQTTDGGYIIVGWTESFGFGRWDVWLIKTGEYGNMQWNKTFGTPRLLEGGYSIQQTTDGGYIIAGWEGRFVIPSSADTIKTENIFFQDLTDFHTDGQVYLLKTDSDGSPEWNRTFGGISDDWGYSVQQTTDGGYIVAGTTSSYGAGSYDVYLVKTDANGNLEWDKTFGGNDEDWGLSIQQTADGGYIVIGSTIYLGTGDSDIYLLKLNIDSDGDGIPDSEDKCPDTPQDEEALVYGCSCNQILDLKPGEDNGELRNGCLEGILMVFEKKIGWAKDLFE